MIRKILKKISSKYNFIKHLEGSLEFKKKFESKNVVVYDKGDYELVVSCIDSTDGKAYVVLSCINERIFEINFIPNSEIFADILIKTSINKYEKNEEDGDRLVRASAN